MREQRRPGEGLLAEPGVRVDGGWVAVPRREPRHGDQAAGDTDGLGAPRRLRAQLVEGSIRLLRGNPTLVQRERAPVFELEARRRGLLWGGAHAWSLACAARVRDAEQG